MRRAPKSRETGFTQRILSLRTLEDTTDKALKFIRGIALNPSLRDRMMTVGYDEKIHLEGWTLLGKASGFTMTASTNPVAVAIKSLSDWDGSGFLRIHAALSHLHPDQEKYVFEGLESETGVAAVLSVSKLLDRLDSLDGTGPDSDKRKATADADKKAIETLAARGIDATLRKKLREDVKTAQSAPLTATVDTDAEHLEALKALRSWYEDWSETARSAFDKRSDLIKLGLAKRKAHAEEPAPATPPAGSPATPSAPVPPTAPHA